MNLREAIVEMKSISALGDEQRWRYARLFHEYAPANRRGTGPKGSGQLNNEKLRQLLEKSDSDVKLNTAISYRNVARVYSPEQQGIATFLAHSLLVTHPDRYELVKSPIGAKEADLLIGRTRTKTAGYEEDPFVNIRDALGRLDTALRKINLTKRTHPRSEEIIEICYTIGQRAMEVVDAVGEGVLA